MTILHTFWTVVLLLYLSGIEFVIDLSHIRLTIVHYDTSAIIVFLTSVTLQLNLILQSMKSEV